MTIYTVVVSNEATPNSFREHLTKNYPNDHFWVAPNVCLVAGVGQAKDMSDALGISDGSSASGIVSAMGSYYGRAPTNVWDWIKAKWEQTSNQ